MHDVFPCVRSVLQHCICTSPNVRSNRSAMHCAGQPLAAPPAQHANAAPPHAQNTMPASPPQPAATAVDMNRLREHLEGALDWMHDNDVLFLQKYEIFSSLHQRSGGQGMVQFAEDAKSKTHVAIKVCNSLSQSCTAAQASACALVPLPITTPA